MAVAEDVFAHLEGLVGSLDESGLLDRFQAVVTSFGGAGFACASLPEKTRMVVDHNRGLEGWCDHFLRHNLVKACPVTKRIAAEVRPFLWGDVRQTAEGPAAMQVFRDAEDFGLTDGLIVPVRTQRGFKGDVFVSIARDLITPTIQSALTMLAMAFQSRLELFHAQTPLTPVDVTPRERDILNWFAMGKSADDVGEILGVSTATVMFHYRNVAQRYGTLSRTHTVVEAIKHGVLCF